MQGDSLSPLLFVLYIDIISHTLHEQVSTIDIQEIQDEDKDEEPFTAKVNHFYYIDDLKVFIRNPEEAERAHMLIKELHRILGLEVNLDKSGITFHNVTEIPQELKEIPEKNNSDPYKYLGVLTGTTVINGPAIINIKQKVAEKMDEIARTESSSVNYFRRVNAKIMGLLRYSFATLEWPLTQLDAVDKLIRRKMRDAKIYGNGMSMYRLYVDRKELGHGLPNARDEYGMELLRTIVHYA